MRKRSKYRPKPVLSNPLGYVLEGMEQVKNRTDHAMKLRIMNHMAMVHLTQGKATREDIDALIAMVNMVEAMYRLGFGKEFTQEVKDGLDALYSVAVRGRESNRFILKAEEMKALNVVMDLHDAQLDVATVKDMDRAVALVSAERRQKKMRIVAKQ